MENTEKVQCRYFNGDTAFKYALGGNPVILCSLNPCPYGDNLGEAMDPEGEHAINPKAFPETRVCKIKGFVDKGLLEKID